MMGRLLALALAASGAQSLHVVSHHGPARPGLLQRGANATLPVVLADAAETSAETDTDEPQEEGSPHNVHDVAGKHKEGKPSERHEWSYKHPEEWDDHWEECGHAAQSPVDIRAAEAGADGGDRLASHFAASAVDHPKLLNRGHNVQVNGHFGRLELPDGEYDVKQFHFHFPSEHTVDGKHAAGEIHIVHQRRGALGMRGLVAISILLDEGDTEASLLQGDRAAASGLVFLRALGFGEHTPVLAKGETRVLDEKVDIYSAYEASFRGPYWHYRGSLTTPPCSETVHWYVLQRRGVVTKDMVASFKHVFPDPSNYRPTQPLNGRELVASRLALPGEYDTAGAEPRSAACSWGPLPLTLAASLAAALRA